MIRETVHDSAASADGGDLSRASSAERQSLCSTAAQPERAQQAGSIVSSQSNLSPSPSVMSLDEEAYATDSGFVARGEGCSRDESSSMRKLTAFCYKPPLLHASMSSACRPAGMPHHTGIMTFSF